MLWLINLAFKSGDDVGVGGRKPPPAENYPGQLMCYILYTSTLCGHTLAPVVAHHRDVDSLLACWWLPVATLDVLSLATNMTVRTQQLVFYEPIFAGIEV